jgi:hypothetical protein
LPQLARSHIHDQECFPGTRHLLTILTDRIELRLIEGEMQERGS